MGFAERLRERVFVLVTCIAAIGLADDPTDCGPRSFINLGANESYTLASNPGSDEYPSLTTCEWFINGTEDSDIVLSFSNFDTECNYDFVYVFDGLENSPSRLLGAFSGDDVATEMSVVAHSSAMRIILQSDVNYRGAGFVAQIDVLDNCGYDGLSYCNGRGSCSIILEEGGRKCDCDPGWGGFACQLEHCPLACSSPNGSCRDNEACVCQDGYTGIGCEFELQNNTWYRVSDAKTSDFPGEIGRAGHSTVVVNDELWIVGGYQLGSVYVNGSFSYNPVQNSWRELTFAGSMPGRYMHTSVIYGSSIWVFGGIMYDANSSPIPVNFENEPIDLGLRTNELYRLNTDSLTISLVSSSGDIPPPVYGHSATTVTSGPTGLMVVLGGSHSGYFNDRVYELNLLTLTWEAYTPSGATVFVAGHSAVFHDETGLIYVFGGFSPVSSAYSSRQNTLFAYSPNERLWTEIDAINRDVVPQRSLHTASLVDDKMVIFGGNHHQHHQIETCHSPDTFIYSIRCNSWIKLNISDATSDLGRFGHSSVVINGSIYSMGGFTGEVVSDILIMIPDDQLCTNVDLTTTDTCVEAGDCDTQCYQYGGCRTCTMDRLCHWDAASSICEAIAGSNPFLPNIVTNTAECPGNVSEVGGFLSKSWSSVLSFARAHIPSSHRLLSTCSTDAGDQADFAEMIEGNTVLVNGTHFFEVTTTSTATLSLYQTASVNPVVSLTATNNTINVTLNVGLPTLEIHLSLTVLTSNEYHSASVSWQRPGTGMELIGGDLSIPIPRPVTSCAEKSDCSSCSADFRCAWCIRSDGIANGCTDVSNTSACDLVAMESESCASCGDFMDCETCQETPLASCQWTQWTQNLDTWGCSAQSFGVANEACPASCSSRSNCSQCSASPQCIWCSSSNRCLDGGDYTLDAIFGQCEQWSYSCTSCAQYSNCADCNSDARCGWCETDAPSFGVSGNGSCIEGSRSSYVFGNEIQSSIDNTCQFSVANESAPANCTDDCIIEIEGEWNFDQCTDVDECLANETRCGPNATCINTIGSYYCECDDGYVSGENGRPNPEAGKVCTPQCCDNAICHLPFDCQCNTGWTGSNCSVDCGCNLHAACPIDENVVGVCSECLDNTEGATCDQCAPGYYGDPRDGGECLECQCFGHGIADLGTCNSTTGECYCTDLTEGINCEACQAGYTRIGDNCYTDCEFSRYSYDPLLTVRQKLVAPSAGIRVIPLNHQSRDHVSTTCFWYIEAPSPNYSIQLTFEKLNAECFYDFVHVFDGQEAIPDNMIAAYAGVHLPDPIISTTGKMLVTFRSDEGFVITGRSPLQAVYRMFQCLNDCSEHGSCLSDGSCLCDTGYHGLDCSQPYCGVDCPGCVTGASAADLYCRCALGFTGINCSEIEQDDHWYKMNTPLVPGERELNGLAGLSTVYDSVNNTAWSFGGFDLRYYSNTLLKLDLSSHITTSYLAPVSGWPRGRYLHTAALYNNNIMIVFGGSDGPGSFLSDLWFAVLGSDLPSWQQQSPTGSAPPATMGHSATVVGGYMYVFGGLTNDRGITNAFYRLDIVGSRWDRIYPLGTPSDGAWRHSAAIFGTKILFFGGRRSYIFATTGSYTDERTSNLQSYDTVTDVWEVILPTSTCNPNEDCYARMMHTATVVDERFMIVFGGCPFKHGFDQLFADFECHTNDLLILDLECPTDLGWITQPATSNVPGRPMSRSAHSSIYRESDRRITILGGWNGDALNDVVEYIVPENFCFVHRSRLKCLLDSSGCVWNVTSSTCGNYTENTKIEFGNSTVEAFYGPAANCTTRVCAGRHYVPERHFSNIYNDECSGNCQRYPGCGICYPEAILASTSCSPMPFVSCDEDAVADLIAPDEMCSSRCNFLKTCNDCHSDQSCLWIGENVTSAQPNPCIERSSSLIPQGSCPISCHSYTSKSLCRSGGCGWCEQLETCFSPWDRHTEYSFGQCFEYNGDADTYFCENQTTCGECLSTARCGWCADPGATGAGSCMSATEMAPDTCVADSTNSSEPSSWHFYQCPDVNECITGANMCSANSTCYNIDNTIGRYGPNYGCLCDEGYELDPSNPFMCIPVCSNPCVFGTCALPEVCECNLGWTGISCDIDCGCNGHSECKSGIGICDNCEESTEGQFCELCSDGYFGNATLFTEPYNGRCLPCFQVCNGHSTDCKRSPGENRSVCLGCTGNTHGEYCENCNSGYFIDPILQETSYLENFSGNRGESESQRKGRIYSYVSRVDVMAQCIPCDCNGHSGNCDPLSGEGCVCEDSTTNPANLGDSGCQVARDDKGSCYNLQCSLCETHHLEIDGAEVPLTGSPFNGTFCYRTVSEMEIHGGILNSRDSVAFKVTKKYKNVHIRVYIRTTIPTSVNAYILTNADASRINFSDPEVSISEDPPVAAYLPLQKTEHFTVWEFDSVGFEESDLHVILERTPASVDGPHPEYEFFFTQAQVTNLHLFVFFTSFFAAFFLVLFTVGMIFTLKAVQAQRNMAVQEAVELENMSQRPIATVRLLLSSKPIYSRQAVAIAALQSSQTLKTTPIAMQPHNSGNACVNTFIVESPTNMKSGYRNFYIGVALVRGEAIRPIPAIDDVTPDDNRQEASNGRSSEDGISEAAL